MYVVVIRYQVQARREGNPRWRTMNVGWNEGEITHYNPVESAKLTQIFRLLSKLTLYSWIWIWILDSSSVERTMKKADG